MAAVHSCVQVLDDPRLRRLTNIGLKNKLKSGLDLLETNLNQRGLSVKPEKIRKAESGIPVCLQASLCVHERGVRWIRSQGV